MSLPYFISKRLNSKLHSKFTRFIISLATIATALSVAVMILSVGIIVGFKDSIKDKLFVFWDHAQVTENIVDAQSIIPEMPFLMDAKLINTLQNDEIVKDVQPYLLKSGILKTSTAMEGIMAKGIEKDFLLGKDLGIEASTAEAFTNGSIIISKQKAQTLSIQKGDSLLFYFMDLQTEAPRVRKLKVIDFFHTGMAEIDDQFALAPLNYIQSLDQYNELAVHGLQIQFQTHQNLEESTEHLYQSYIEPPSQIFPLSYVYPNIFGWLELLDKNAYIIIIIMSVVAIINLSTALLIFIVDRTPMVGILTAQGATGSQIQKIFIRQGIRIAIKGILWGLVIGVGLGLLQAHFKWIKLDEVAYYMDYVPVSLIWWHVLLILLGSLLMIALALYLPALFARRIQVLRALKL